jgi:hypothetical protein
MQQSELMRVQPCLAFGSSAEFRRHEPRPEDVMKFATALLAPAALLATACAQAAVLTVVNVAAPAVNCVFNASCTVVVNDSTGTFAFLPYGKDAFLQSRTYAGAAGTPAAGFTAYEYRVDLRSAPLATECLAGLVLDFGPVKMLTYPQNQPAHVFVVTQGGLGNVGIKSAEQDGDVIIFTFSSYLCAGQTSHFFGLVSAKSPQTITATLFGFGQPAFIQLAARVPQHLVVPVNGLLPPTNLKIKP